MESIGGFTVFASIAVRLAVDFIKSKFPTIGSRGIQICVALLSVGAALVFTNGNVTEVFWTAAGAVYAGAIAFYELFSKQRENR